MKFIKYLGLLLVISIIIVSIIYDRYYGMVPFYREVKRILIQQNCNYLELSRNSNGSTLLDPLSGIDRLNPVGNYCYISSVSKWRCDFVNIIDVEKYLNDDSLIVSARRIMDEGYDIWILKKDSSIEHKEYNGKLTIFLPSEVLEQCQTKGKR